MPVSFEWDDKKNQINRMKHRVDFNTAQYAFIDPKRVIAEDTAHSQQEKRYYCFGKVAKHILTVRFTYRNNHIRIIGAGYWRKGKTIYEKENNLSK